MGRMRKAGVQMKGWEVRQALALGGVSQLDPGKLDPNIRVDLSRTLPVMESRKSMRRVHGTYFPTRPVLTWFLFWILLATSFLQSIDWQSETVLVKFSVHFGATPAQNVLAGVAYIVVLTFIFLLVNAQVHFHMFWSLGLTVVFLIVQSLMLIRKRGGNWDVQATLLGVYLLAQLVGLACQAFAWRAFPALQRRLWYLNKVELQGTQPLKRIASHHRRTLPPLEGRQASCSFKYVGPISRRFPRCIRQRRTFHLSYAGQVNQEGRPHGYGEWMDTYYYGEELRGVWCNGVPVGPFKARESGSGSAFVNLRIGYVQNRKDRAGQARSTSPTALTFGVMAVECGTAGLFFRDYPQATPITGPRPLSAVPNPKEACDVEAGASDPSADMAAALQTLLDNMPITRQLRPGVTASMSAPRVHTPSMPSHAQHGDHVPSPLSKPRQHMPVTSAARTPQDAVGAHRVAEQAREWEGRVASQGAHTGDGGLHTHPATFGPHGTPATSGLQRHTAEARSTSSPADGKGRMLSVGHALGPGGGVEERKGDTDIPLAMGQLAEGGPPVLASRDADSGRIFDDATAHMRHAGQADGMEAPSTPRTAAAILARAEGRCQAAEVQLYTRTPQAHVSSGVAHPTLGGGGVGQDQGDRGSWGQAVILERGSGGPASARAAPHAPEDRTWPGPAAYAFAHATAHAPDDRTSQGHGPYPSTHATAHAPDDSMSLGPGAHPSAHAAGHGADVGMSPGPAAALVFIHGCNCSLSDGCKSLGQFMALANLPPRIRPFVFSWPTGTLVNYLAAKVEGAEAQATGDAFSGFLRGLGDVGFEEVHIMTHSMGVRVLMAAIPQLEILFGMDPCERSNGGSPKGRKRLGIRLASVSLLNPDYELERFTGGQGQRLCALCPLITVYGDREDVALWGAAIFNGLHKAWKTIKEPLQGQPKCCASVRSFALVSSMGRHVYDIVDAQGEPLDLDVVDTTFLDANVQEARHMSFNLNSSLVDDLREVVTMQRRAWERNSGLDARGGNVFSFLVAPTYIKNK